MSENPTRRYDLLAALVATFVSVLALAVSAYSTYWQRQQTRAATWPRLVAHEGGSTEGKTPFVMSFANAGTGPLEVQTLVLKIDGKPVHTTPELFEIIGGLVPQKKDSSADVSLHMFESLGPGEKVEFLSIESEETSKSLSIDLFHGKDRIVVTACYCSLLGECWTSGGEAGKHAVEVTRCASTPDNFLETSRRSE